MTKVAILLWVISVPHYYYILEPVKWQPVDPDEYASGKFPDAQCRIFISLWCHTVLVALGHVPFRSTRSF